MGVNEYIDAAMNYLQKYSPIMLIIAALSVADLIITMLVKIMKQAPTFGMTRGRRTR